MILPQMFPGKDPEKEVLRSALILRMVASRLNTLPNSGDDPIFRAWIQKYPEDGYSFVAQAILFLFEDRPQEAFATLLTGLKVAKNERAELTLAKEKLLASFPELHLLELNIDQEKNNGKDQLRRAAG